MVRWLEDVTMEGDRFWLLATRSNYHCLSQVGQVVPSTSELSALSRSREACVALRFIRLGYHQIPCQVDHRLRQPVHSTAKDLEYK